MHSHVNNNTLDHRSTGTGDPVLFIHGAVVADMLRPIAEAPALSEYHRITYHRRGYGGSSRSGGPTSLVDQVDDAAGLLDVLRLGAVHVVGHSLGAVIAMMLAARHPDRVRSLALIEPPAPLDSVAGAAFMGAIRPLLERYLAGDREGAVHAFLGMIGKPGWAELMERVAPGSVAQAVRDADTAFGTELAAAAGWTESLGAELAVGVRCPVLSVLGTESGPLFSAGRTALHRWFPECREADIVGASHEAPLEQPDAITSVLGAFLSRAAATQPVARS